MAELSEQQEAILIECLEAIEAGADVETCLARFPEHGSTLRPYLDLHARLRAADKPEPPATAYEAGRRTLIDRVVEEQVQRAHGSSLQAAGTRWGMPLVSAFGTRWSRFREALQNYTSSRSARLQSPLARVAAAAALLLVLGSGALGASAAVGFEPAREVLSTLQIVDYDDAEDEGRIDGDKKEPNEGDEQPPSADKDEPESATPPASEKDDADETDPSPTVKPQEPEPTATPWPSNDVQPAPRADDVAPTPRRNDVAPTPRPDDVAPTPKPDRPTPTPKPDLPTPTPKPDEPTPTAKPDVPTAPKPTKTPLAEQPLSD